MALTATLPISTERHNVTLPVTPSGTPSHSAELSDSDLTIQIQESVERCHRFERPFLAEIRNRLLPLLDVAVDRIKNGHPVNGCQTVNAFYASVGVKPGTVRMWRMRDKNEQGKQNEIESQKPQHEAQITVKAVIATSKELIKEINAIKKLGFAGLSEDERSELVRELKLRGKKLESLAKELEQTGSHDSTALEVADAELVLPAQ